MEAVGEAERLHLIPALSPSDAEREESSTVCSALMALAVRLALLPAFAGGEDVGAEVLARPHHCFLSLIWIEVSRALLN